MKHAVVFVSVQNKPVPDFPAIGVKPDFSSICPVLPALTPLLSRFSLFLQIPFLHVSTLQKPAFFPPRHTRRPVRIFLEHVSLQNNFHQVQTRHCPVLTLLMPLLNLVFKRKKNL
jgi:hypothetical protein